MADYSDSEEDEIIYSTTSVLLGYAEEDPSSDDSISHLGGLPTWFDASSPADSRLAKCSCCNQVMPLLLQLDGNIPESPNHQRMLYVFSCRSRTCRRKPGSIRSLRGVRVTGKKQEPVVVQTEAQTAETLEKKKDPLPSKSSMIFGAKADSSTTSSNPFTSAPNKVNPFASSGSSTNPFAAKPKPPTITDSAVTSLTQTFSSVASINATKAASPPSKPDRDILIGPPSPWPEASTIPSYPSFFLDAHYEELEPQTDAITRQAAELAKTMKIEEDDMDVDESSSSKKTKNDKGEAFESTINKAFDHFTTMVSQNPEQVLRYERGGIPLLYSRNDVVGNILSPITHGGKVVTTDATISTTKVPKCKSCSGERVFELQLMPHTISVLEDAEGVDALWEGMEWGTIIVATCKQDCKIVGGGEGNSGGYVEEWVGVQWEEEMRR